LLTTTGRILFPDDGVVPISRAITIEIYLICNLTAEATMSTRTQTNDREMKDSDACISTNQHQAPVARGQKRVEVGDEINLEGLSGRTTVEGEQQLLSSYNQALEVENRYHEDRHVVLLAQQKWKDERIAELLSVNRTFLTQETLLDPLNHVACRAFIDNLIRQAQHSGSHEERVLKLAKALSTQIPFSEEQINKTLMYGSTSRLLLG
jgi:HD-GYP domain-containing protein (c-di-GMP phosphodiesterase class II)